MRLEIFWVCLYGSVLGSRASSFENAGPEIRDQVKPNIIFILTDDQDMRMDSLDHMPILKRTIADEGTSYPRHYCTVSLCCPARAVIWTGRQAHNTNVTDLAPPYGGYPKFVDQGFNDDYLPLWLQSAGYNTYYIGKLFNSHTTDNYNAPYANGWTGSEFLLDPYTYQYWSPGFVRNRGTPVIYNGSYSTDLVFEKSFAFLDDAVSAGSPFFLTIAPIAPHANGGPEGTMPIPAPRHLGLFNNSVVPRNANFNPDVPSGASWVKALAKLNDTGIAFNDLWYRNRLRCLQAVDENIGALFDRLENSYPKSVLENTYIFFSSDNGFHLSQHRLAPGKTCGYEEDVNVPLLVRGPGIAKGKVSNAVSAHVDFAPTFLSLAGISMREDFDGQAIPLQEQDQQSKIEHASIEMWRLKAPAEQGASTGAINNTYKSIRLIGKDYNLYYSVWCTNEHELYDMTTDTFQMRNLFVDGFNNQSCSSRESLTSFGVSVYQLASRLDALLFLLKSCKGESCRHPWETLMPGQNVKSLHDALVQKYDTFFGSVPRVSFTSCQAGYIVSEEGPQYGDWAGSRLETRADGGDPEWALWT
ncbi:Arylsulphatase [Thozetella sp. PMI_491]|nr:Arylsulphatase [Thozetella sp. PMI_491]